MNTKWISLGRDCHPAMVLKSTGNRLSSYPFDWQNTSPELAIDYVIDNIRTEFNYYMDDIYMNYRGYPVSKKYPSSEFMHFPEIANSENLREKFKQRCNSFMETLESNDGINYILSITRSELLKIGIKETLEALEYLKKFLPQQHKIFFYIRNESSFDKESETIFHSGIIPISGIHLYEYERYKAGLNKQEEFNLLFKSLNELQS